MKKKYILIGSIAVLAVLVSIWLLTRPQTLGNLNHAYSEPETSVSTFSFSGEAGDRIKFSFTSKIENGDLDIIVIDSNGNVVKELDRAKRLETFLNLEHSDTYTVKAEYQDFVGNFKLAVYQID